MDDVAPVVVDRLLVGDADEVDIGAVDEAALAVELGHPDRHRRRIGDQPETLLALAQPVFGRRVLADRGDGRRKGRRPRRLRRGPDCSRRSARPAPRCRRAAACAARIRRTGSRRPARARHSARSGPRRRPRSRAPAGRKRGRGRRGSRHRRHCRRAAGPGPSRRTSARSSRAPCWPRSSAIAARLSTGPSGVAPNPAVRPATSPARRETGAGAGMIGLDGDAVHRTLAAPTSRPAASLAAPLPGKEAPCVQRRCGARLHLAQHAQQVAAHDLGDVGLAQPLAPQPGADPRQQR